MSSVKKLYDIHIEYEDGKKYSKYDIKYENLSHNDKVSKISIVGAGMVSTPGITYKMFRSLAQEKINILAKKSRFFQILRE